MVNNVLQVKRTSTSGRTPNTTASYATNTQYIAAGEFALNMADGILYSSNGTAVITVGANLVNQNISNTLQVANINFESTANNQLVYSANTLTIRSGGANVIFANTTTVAARANVAMANNYFTEPTLKSYKEYTEIGGTVTTSYTANLALSNIFTLTGTNGSNCVFTIGSPPVSGNAQMFTIVFKQPATGSANVTWPAAVKWSYGDTPVISSTVNARDVFTFLTFDGGTTYLGAYSMANVAS